MTVVPDGSAELLESMVQMGVQLVDERYRATFNSPEVLLFSFVRQYYMKN